LVTSYQCNGFKPENPPLRVGEIAFGGEMPAGVGGFHFTFGAAEYFTLAARQAYHIALSGIFH